MIWTVVRVGLLRMWHGKVELLLTFVVPIAFFTVFAFIFDEQIGLGKSPRVDLAIVDEDSTELSREFSSTLAEWETLHIYAPADHGDGLFVFSSTEPARASLTRGSAKVTAAPTQMCPASSFSRNFLIASNIVRAGLGCG